MPVSVISPVPELRAPENIVMPPLDAAIVIGLLAVEMLELIVVAAELSVTDALSFPVIAPLTVMVPEGERRMTGSVKVTALTVMPPLLSALPIVMLLKPF